MWDQQNHNEVRFGKISLSLFPFIDKLSILIELGLAIRQCVRLLDLYEKKVKKASTCWHIWGAFAKLTYGSKVETPVHDNIRELATWECKEHGVKS